MGFSVGQISASITADNTDFNRVMKEVNKAGLQAANKIEGQFQQVGKSLRGIGRRMTAGISVPLLGIGISAVKTAANYETLRQSMDSLNGSAEEGARNFERLKEFSSRTPFQLKDLAQAQNMLQGFGLAADDAFNSISMIGDIASITGGDIQGIGIAFGQAAAEGRLMTQDIRQLINQGVPAIQLLANTMGVAESDILDLASQGRISFDILQKAFRDATTEGGMFANGMAKQSNTISGVFSTLKDNVSLALGELGVSIVETLDIKQVVKDLTANLKTITNRFASLSEETRTEIIKIAGLFMAGGPLLVGLGVAASAVAKFTQFVSKKFLAISATTFLILGTVEQMSQGMAKLFHGADFEMDGFADGAKRRLGEILGPIQDFVLEITGVKDGLQEVKGLFANLPGSGAFEAVAEGASAASTAIAKIPIDAPKAAQGVSGAFLSIGDSVRGLSDEYLLNAKAVAVFGSAVEAALQPVSEAWDSFGNRLANGVGPMIQSALGEITNSFIEASAIAAVTGSSFKGVFQAVLGTIADLAVQVGKVAIGVALAIKGIKEALKSLNPGVALAAGVALVGLGAATKAALSKVAEGNGDNIPKFHSGGRVPGVGEQLIMAQAGEYVLTGPQMKSLGSTNQMQSGNIDGRAVQYLQGILNHLKQHTDKLGPDEVFVMSQKGRTGY